MPHQAATLHGSQWPRHDLLFAPTSNGFAAGPTVDFAAEQALLEVIERDAFCIAWAHRLATEPMDARTVPDPDCRRGGRAVPAGAASESRCICCPPTAPRSWRWPWAGATDDPAAVVGPGGRPEPLRAARSAVLEVGQVRPALRARLLDPAVLARRAELVADTALVHELEDHDLLYSDAAAARRGWRTCARPSATWRSPAPRGHGLDDLVASLARVAGDVLIVDVTPPTTSPPSASGWCGGSCPASSRSTSAPTRPGWATSGCSPRRTAGGCAIRSGHPCRPQPRPAPVGLTMRDFTFADDTPAAWTYHRSTARWLFNASSGGESPPVVTRPRERRPALHCVAGRRTADAAAGRGAASEGVVSHFPTGRPAAG